MINAPSKIDLARLSTPLQPLERFSESLAGPTIWVKRDDLTGSVESGNKIRKLEYVFAEAIKQGCDTVITCGGTQSNHCRATAATAAKLGLHCHLLLREDQPAELAKGNLLLDQILGATVQIFPKAGFSAELKARFAATVQDYAQKGSKAYCIPTGASDGVGLWGYIGTAKELKADFVEHNIAPKTLVCATGSAGTQAGLTLGSRIHELGARVIGYAVCDSAEYFYHKVKQDWRDWQQRYAPDFEVDDAWINTNEDFIGPGYGQANAPVFETIVELAKTEGLVLDPTYTAKAFHGLVEGIKNGDFAGETDVVFVHTGGIYGLMAVPESLSAHIDSLDTLRHCT